MLWFRRKTRAPSLCPGNHGIGTQARLELASGDRKWTEEADLVDLAVAALKKHGHSVTVQQGFVTHRDSGLLIQPQLIGVELLEQGGRHTVTTVQVNHPTLAPEGVFEYQHATGDNVADSVAEGLDQWAQLDLVPLLGALQPTPQSCTTMMMRLPATKDRSELIRRAVLGPVCQFMQQPPAQEEDNAEDEHPFCPCCLLTNTFEAFRDTFGSDATACLRLYAARDEEGNPQADCRINGEDWEPGAKALRNYAETWPNAGFEFRKQYVVIQTIREGTDLADGIHAADG